MDYYCTCSEVSSLAEAQSKCVFFYLLTEIFLIDFTVGLILTLPKKYCLDFEKKNLLKPLVI
jgi:hypothetical protein